MKRILFTLLLAIVGTTALFAQDIIITNDAIRIDAKILEITDYEVKYTQYGDPNERIKTINTSSIASIVFENGEVHTFKQPEPMPKPEVKGEDPVSQLLKDFEMSDSEKGEENENSSTEEDDEDFVEYIPGMKFTFDKRRYVYGENVMKERNFGDFIEHNCSEAYDEFHKRNKSNIASICLMAGGGGIMLYSAPGLIGKRPFKIIAATLVSCGFASLITGIVLKTTFKKHQHKALEIFNENCSEEKRTASLSLSVSPVGAGLTLNF